MASPGQELKRERELRGLSLKEIAASTKISLKFLKALEDDQPEMLPGRFFVKGVLRSYSRAIGLDEDYVLNKYQEDLLQREETRSPAHRTGTGRLRFKSQLILPLAVAVVILGLIVLSMIILLRPKRTAQPVETRRAAAAASMPAPAVALPLALPEATKPEVRGLALELSFTQETWVQVYADGSLVLDGIKRPGQTANFQADREFVFNLGNAGGMTYTLNGRKGKPMGGSGEVVRDIRITLQDYQDFVLPEAERRG